MTERDIAITYDPETMEEFSDSRYVVAAETANSNNIRKVVFLSNDLDGSCHWTGDIFSPNILFETELEKMKALVDIGIDLANLTSDNLCVCNNVRPVLMVANLEHCYTEYLKCEERNQNTELLKRFEKEFTTTERTSILNLMNNK